MRLSLTIIISGRIRNIRTHAMPRDNGAAVDRRVHVSPVGLGTLCKSDVCGPAWAGYTHVRLAGEVSQGPSGRYERGGQVSMPAAPISCVFTLFFSPGLQGLVARMK